MNPTLIRRLEELTDRRAELDHLLADPEIIGDPNQFQRLAREHAEISPLVASFDAWSQTGTDLDQAHEMLAEGDPELRDLAESEITELKARRATLESELMTLLTPRDPDDERNIFVEIRAGTGGDEASLFAADLLKMYLRYAERRGWTTAVVSQAASEVGGFKEVIARIAGAGAYARMKFESGAHRVQRIPQTESQGRIHTSACTVAVLPEVDEISGIEINPSDLRIDTYRASGAGGQHVNKTDSAIRITHLPTNTVVECQDERSQHKNRARAMSLLQARLLEEERSRQRSAEAANRKSLVGSGDRSERIRTYNFPQGRVTDHRINLTLFKLEEFLEGDLDAVIEPLISEHNAEQLAALAETEN